MLQQGWISIHRKIKECWLYNDKPFDRTHAWLDILLSANHQDKKISLGNELILVKRGTFITSELKLMNKWGWGKEKTRKFLKLLEQDGMIKKVSDKKKTLIEIINYDIYQNQTTSNQDIPSYNEYHQTTDRPQTDHEQTTDRPRADTNNNDNNANNSNNDNKDINTPKKTKKKSKDEVPKKVYAENVLMTEAEYNKLTVKHGEVLAGKMIDTLSNYKCANGKKYVNDYKAILTWVEDKVLKEVNKGVQNGISRGNNQQA
jgi:hypothetical protein